VFAPCFTTMLSAMNLASSVAVAVAVGTPGIGNVNTGLLPTQATDVLPIVVTSDYMCDSSLLSYGA
jgi:hypothetical protein